MRWLLLIIVFLSGSLAVSVRSCSSIRADRDRLSDNQRTLLSDVEFYRTRDSLSVASVERLTLRNGEFRKYAVDLERTVEDLSLEVRRLKSASRSAVRTEYEVRTVVRDSVVAVPGRTDTLSCVDYRDGYLTFSGCITGKEFSGFVESRDTIVQVVHRVPRRFLFFRFGTKGIRQEVVSRNPHGRVVFTEYIELKK